MVSMYKGTGVLIRPSARDLERLKVPFGKLITGGPGETIPKLKLMIEEATPPMVVTVGDVVSRETLKAGLNVRLRIVDNRSMRKEIPESSFPARYTYSVKNPPGVITMEAWQIIRRALREKEAVVFVEGEEDLLVLPVIMETPDNSFVVYGQPKEGLVIVTATASKKKEVATMMEQMIREDPSQ